MNELRMKMHRIAREEADKVLPINIERIAPFPVSTSAYMGSIESGNPRAEFENLVGGKDSFYSKDIKTPFDLNTFGSEAGYYSEEYSKKLDSVAKTAVKKRKIEKDIEDIKSGIRQDFGTHSTIKINKFLLDGKYSNIRLINADKYQRLFDPQKWEVVVLYAGSGRDNNAIGMIVRRDVSDNKNVSRNSILGDI